MTHPWPDLVLRLEAIELDAYFDDPDGLENAMAQRQTIIEQLAAADRTLLEPEVYADLRERLRAVHQRDEIILSVLIALRDQTREELAKANTGKRAMSGYQSVVSSAPPPFRRIG